MPTAAAERRRAQPAQTAQINVRIERSLKEAGDAALGELGISPSEAVRALWASLSRRGAARDQMLAMLASSAEREAGGPGRGERSEAVERMAARYAALGSGRAAALPALDERGWDDLAWEDLQGGARSGGVL